MLSQFLHKIALQNDNIVTELSTLDYYAERKHDHREVSNINFVSKYFVKSDSLHGRTKPVIVKTFPSYHANPKSPDYTLWCKYQLLKYRHSQGTQYNASNNLQETEDVFVSSWNDFLQTLDMH